MPRCGFDCHVIPLPCNDNGQAVNTPASPSVLRISTAKLHRDEYDGDPFRTILHIISAKTVVCYAAGKVTSSIKIRETYSEL